MSLFSLILAAHIASGTAALLTLAVPFLSKWGGRLHRRVGTVFAVSMGGVSLSAWLLSALRLLDPDPKNDDAALFLAHVGLLSATSVWMGARAARLKRNVASRTAFDVAWLLTLIASSLALFVGGVSSGDPLWIVFSVIGFLGGVTPLRYLLGKDAHPHAWMVQHLSSMGTGAISALTAFFVVNVARLGLEDYSLFFWIAPGVLGGFVLSLLSNRVRAHGLQKPARARSALATSRG